MPRRSIPLVAGQYYHVYNRGHNRQPIFFTQDDYGLFLRRFRHFISPNDAIVIAYVLMPNHYHFVVRCESDQFAHAMRLFGISYSKIINRQYDRVGGLFQGAYQAKLVECDEYLLHLSQYVHFNPVKAGLVDEAAGWPYSSYPEYVGQRFGTLPQPSLIWQLLADRAGRPEAALENKRFGLYDKYFREDTGNNIGTIQHLLFA